MISKFASFFFGVEIKISFPFSSLIKGVITLAWPPWHCDVLSNGYTHCFVFSLFHYVQLKNDKQWSTSCWCCYCPVVPTVFIVCKCGACQCEHIMYVRPWIDLKEDVTWDDATIMFFLCKSTLKCNRQRIPVYSRCAPLCWSCMLSSPLFDFKASAPTRHHKRHAPGTCVFTSSSAEQVGPSHEASCSR